MLLYKDGLKSEYSRFDASVWLNQFTFFYVLFVVVLFSVARLVFVYSYGGSNIDNQLLMDTLYWGARFDLRVATLMCVLFYVLVQMFILINPNGVSRVMFWYRNILFLLMSIACVLVVINHFYYQNFQNHIDIFIFEFLDWENTTAVSQTIWQDYPVVTGVLFLFVLIWICIWLGSKLHRATGSMLWLPAQSLRSVYIILCVALLMVSARGSTGTFPLMLTQISIAGDLLLNRAVANGPMAFSDAWEEWRAMQSIQPVSDKVFKHAYQTWFGQTYVEGKTVFAADSFAAIDAEQLPDVVVVQMESLGGHVAELQSESNPILGSLAKHKVEDYWFNHFLSSTKGTLNSMEKLLANAGLRNISQSSYRKTALTTAPATMFKKLGYHTVFLTSGSKTWSNLDQFLPYQGFDEILDAQDIRAALKDVENDEAWGVFDAHTFEYLKRYLQKEHEKPVFVYMMTITNHSPYVLPEKYKEVQLSIPQNYKAKVFKANMKKANLVMQTYQYASDSLGVFMTDIKTSALKDNTIVAATGDHYMRDLFNYYMEEGDVFEQYRVPFYLYLPDYLKTDITYDAARVGSHKDIFPTIFSRLSTEPVLLTGSDMLSSTDIYSFMGMGEEFAISSVGAVLNLGDQPRFYQWNDGVVGHGISPTSAPSKALSELYEKHKAYHTLLQWNTAQSIGIKEKSL